MNTPSQRILLSLSSLLLLASGAAFAGEIRLEWDAVPTASGYRVFYGTSAGQYSSTLDVGPATQAVVTGLTACTQYFIAVKAYNAAGSSAQFSTELSGWPRPEIHSFDPSAAQQGDVFTMNIWGANFGSGASVSWSATGLAAAANGTPLVRLDSLRVLSCNLIQALVTIESPVRGHRAVPIGDLPLAFEVVNPDTVFGVGSRNMDIRFNTSRADINQSDDTTMNRVDGRDLSWLAYAYGQADGGDRYNPDADLDGDGLIDGEDLAMLAPRFGKCWDGTKWGADSCP